MSFKRIILGWIVAFLIWTIVGSILYMNPVVAEYFHKYKDTPAIKSWDGSMNFIIYMELGMLISSLLIAIIYASIVNSLPGKTFIKGLVFGLMLIVLMILYRFFNMWMLTTYPKPLLIIDLINGTIESLFIGMSLALIIKEG